MRNNLIKNNELKPVSIVNVAGFWGGAIHNPEVNGLQSIYDDDFQVLTFFRNHSYLKTSFPQQKSLKGIANDYLIHSKFQTDCNLIETWCSRCFCFCLGEWMEISEPKFTEEEIYKGLRYVCYGNNFIPDTINLFRKIGVDIASETSVSYFL